MWAGKSMSICPYMFGFSNQCTTFTDLVVFYFADTEHGSDIVSDVNTKAERMN